MAATKLNTNSKVKEQPTREALASQIQGLVRKKGIPVKDVDVNEKGHIIIDKDKDPELYDWAVNG